MKTRKAQDPEKTRCYMYSAVRATERQNHGRKAMFGARGVRGIAMRFIGFHVFVQSLCADVEIPRTIAISKWVIDVCLHTLPNGGHTKKNS